MKLIIFTMRIYFGVRRRLMCWGLEWIVGLNHQSKESCKDLLPVYCFVCRVGGKETPWRGIWNVDGKRERSPHISDYLPDHIVAQPHAGASLHAVHTEQVLLGLPLPLYLGDGQHGGEAECQRHCAQWDHPRCSCPRLELEFHWPNGFQPARGRAGTPRSTSPPLA